MSEILKLTDIAKVFNNQKVLNKINISVNKGEIVAIIGPSGSGKSTLLKLIARQHKADEGEILVENKIVFSYKDNKSYAKKVGILSQNLDLIEELSVLNNVLVGRMNEWGALRSLYSLIVPQDKEIAMNSLKNLGIENKANELVSNLSGGEKQRVAFARLLVQNPNLVLADEPISSLDPVRADDVLSTLTNLAKENRITLITTLHSVDYVKRYFSRVIGISKGEMKFDLPVEKVSDDILNELYQKNENE